MAKKTNKTEEKIVAVEEVLSITERFIEKNKNILSIIIGVIIVIVLAYFGFKKMYLAPLEEEAQSQMYIWQNIIPFFDYPADIRKARSTIRFLS